MKKERKKESPRSQISGTDQHTLIRALLTCWKTTGITEMNRGGGVCPHYGRVYRSACLNSVKTFAQEDEDCCGRTVTALSRVQLLHLHIAAPGPVTKDHCLSRHFYWVCKLTTSSLPKTKCFPAFNKLAHIACKPKHGEELPILFHKHNKPREQTHADLFVLPMLIDDLWNENKYQAVGWDLAAFLTFQ